MSIVIVPYALGSPGIPSELIAALMGAILGGLISLGTTWYFAREADRKRNLGLGLSILHKVQHVASNIQHVHDHLAEANAVAAGGRLSGALLPIVGFRTEPIDFTAEELAIFSLAGRAEMTQKLIDTASLHNIIMDALSQYNTRRDLYDDEMSRVGVAFDQQSGMRKTTVDADTMARLAPTLTKLENLAQGLLKLSVDGLAPVLEVARSTSGKIRSALREPRFPVELEYGQPSPEEK